MNKNELIYLASPYSHPDHRTRWARYHAACVAAARLMKRGYRVFSPIAHAIPIAQYGHLHPMDHELWTRQYEPIINTAGRLVILDLPLWNLSTGVVEEVRIARQRPIPVTLWRFGEKGLGRPLPKGVPCK